jgi:phosphatidylglycerol---prolipoprotein diacylglyceryl transferase
MLHHPDIDPIAVSIGPLAIHWYGLMYLGGFAAAWWLGRLRAKRVDSPLRRDQVEDLIFWGAIGVVLGGRSGYVVFYGFEHLLADPLWLIRVWEGGMSFHGGLIGVLLALAWFGRSRGRAIGEIFDFVAPLVPVGLGLGRIGNFIGQELWGRPSDLPWAMVYPRDPLGLARHPSQLYQAALEGVALFGILWWFSSRPRPRLAVSGCFLLLYGIFRFGVEFAREPDPQLGYVAFGWMTRGQLLSVPMVIAGLALLAFAYRCSRLERNATT